AVTDYPITGNDRVLQFATIAFDTAVEEIFPCLTQGGSLVLRTETILHSMEIFLNSCADWGITVLDLPTAFWHQLTATIATENLSLPPNIKLVIIGGEKANEQALNQWQRCVNADVRLLNTYGPTEATVVSTMFEATAEASATSISKGVLIGRPLPNYEVHVLDTALQPVPIGVHGELLIGGTGLARGYLNRPDLTNEKFIPNPFNSSPQARLYKSGDLVRYLPDGNIEFMGRVDDQVKIRGFRVELGEIEAAISQHPHVRENVVTAWEDEDSRKRLVAYLILNQESEGIISEIRSFLKQNLPDYMIPANFVTLNHLPMTPNGKVDRKSLPAPDLTRSEQDHQFTAPRNQIEQTLTQIWSDLLKVENVGIDDNFFELGGDSILSIQIIAKANQAGVKLTPIQIFEHQTVAELAMVAGSSQTIQAEQGEVTGPVNLAPYQQWFFEQDLADPHHWNMAPLLEVKQSLDPDLVEEAVQQLTIHHDALRLRFVRQSDNTWQQTNASVAQSRAVLTTQLDLTGLPASEQDRIMESSFASLQGELNLENGPLIKVALILLGSERPDRLLFIVHHMVVDGISLRILLEDFNQIYEQLSSNQTPTLPAKTTSYQQWTNSLTTYARSEIALQEQDYWLEHLEKQVPRLPRDNQIGVNIEGSTQSVWVSLSVEDTE
ncbi:MAG: AMP-binding protein, partial [Anaerolineae bacterium]|nr:AMP-binding protein [Anaerolineae bacterium]